MQISPRKPYAQPARNAQNPQTASAPPPPAPLAPPPFASLEKGWSRERRPHDAEETRQAALQERPSLLPAPQAEDASSAPRDAGQKAPAPPPAPPKTRFLPPSGDGRTQLPNAQAQAPYSCLLNLEGWENPQLEDGGSGLALNAETGALSGTPKEKGDHVLILSGSRAGRPIRVAARLIVTPEEGSPWNGAPSDAKARYKEDTEAVFIEGGGLRCLAASRRGRSHIYKRGFRDDDFSLHVAEKPEGWTIAVVADGAGSAPFSRRGSQIAVEKIKELLPSLLLSHVEPALPAFVGALDEEAENAARGLLQLAAEKALRDAARDAVYAIYEEAGDKGRRPAEYSTTLLLVATRRFSDSWLIVSFSIGDGVAALLDPQEKQAKLLNAPDGGEFAGQTRFLDLAELGEGEPFKNRVRIETRKSLTALLLMTDGVSDPKFPTAKALQDSEAWRRFWEEDLPPTTPSIDNPEPEKRLLDWLEFWSQGDHDDRTIAILTPVAASAPVKELEE